MNHIIEINSAEIFLVSGGNNRIIKGIFCNSGDPICRYSILPVIESFLRISGMLECYSNNRINCKPLDTKDVVILGGIAVVIVGARFLGNFFQRLPQVVGNNPGASLFVDAG